MSFTYKPLQPEDAEKLDNFFGAKDTFMEFNPGQRILTTQFKDILEDVHEMEVRKDDIWTISFPRTGSTWLQEMIWLIGNDLNFEFAKNNIQFFRAPFLDMQTVLVTEEYLPFMEIIGSPLQYIKKYASPRYIKTHLHPNFLPSQWHTLNPKTIYIARNPRDVCVSCYHYFQLVHDFNATFEEFADLFLNDKVPYAPLWDHYLEYWKKRNETNFLFLKYEDMKKDLKGAIRQTAKFMERTLDEDQVTALCDYLSFKSMKKNRAVNLEPILETRAGKEISNDFIRKGQVGDWKNYMTEKLSKKFDDWIVLNSRGTGLNFD